MVFQSILYVPKSVQMFILSHGGQFNRCMNFFKHVDTFYGLFSRKNHFLKNVAPL